MPTRAAAEQLARTLDDAPAPITAPRPLIGSRAAICTTLLIARLPDPLRAADGFEREAVLAAGAREAEESGAPPPFHVRPALIAEMLALYDHVRRLGRTIDDFDRLLTGELEPAAESDRGAAQLLEQTRFLSAAFRAYESRLQRRRRRRRARRARPPVSATPAATDYATSSSRSAIGRSIRTASGPPM